MKNTINACISITHKKPTKQNIVNQLKTKRKLNQENPLNPLKNNCFYFLSTSKTPQFCQNLTFCQSDAKTPLQATDNKSDNNGAVSIRLSRKAVKTILHSKSNIVIKYRYGLAERLLRRQA